MRPKRLEIEGLGPFRERVEIEFGECELFAFTGATGSGKSSLVDAMVFALYGSVPRYGRRDVAPVVTQGSLQGRVRLDFSLGSQDYTVVRSVRLDARRRVSTEARLERGEDVLAGAAPEVTAAVEGLIGLDFAQFTKCVVLPQGEFDGFLRAQPADRQGLLVALLDLGIYDRVSEQARNRQATAEGEVSALDRRLAGEAGVTAEAVESGRVRVTHLEKLLANLDAALPRLQALRAESTAFAAEVTKLNDSKTRLQSVRLPDGLAGLAGELDRLRAGAAAAEEDIESAEAEVSAVERAMASLPERASLLRAGDRWKTHEEAVQKVAGATAAAEEAAAALQSARLELESAEEDLDRIRREHEVDHLRGGLEVGDPCPVCERVLESLPTRGPRGPLPKAQERQRAAAKAHGEADRAHARAANALAATGANAAELAAGLQWSPEEISASLERIAELVSDLAKAKASRDASRRAAAEARSRLEALAEGERSAKQELQQNLLLLADLSPPALDFDDLTGAWKALLGWVEAKLPEVGGRAVEANGKAEAVSAAMQAIETDLRSACEEAGVAVLNTGFRDPVVAALATERARFEQLTARLRMVGELEAERAGHAVEATVAKALAGHLRANNFEKWLLDEALRVLATGANRRLSDLARGQYSLTLDSRLDFEVIDHQAADERRSVQSLSGGETFLVSLALALSLADHIAEMSVVGTSRLEAIFLDEGFGTLDPESLEAVASVISEIGAGGKMVGIITHVKELAELVPCRFVVRKDAASARVHRHDS